MRSTIVNLISETPLFEGLPEDELSKLANIAVVKSYEKGEVIFSEGEEGYGFFIVAEGTVKIYKLSMEGKELILHIFGTGEPFGEVPVFSGKAFPANAEAIAPSRLLFFPRRDFVRLITENPSLALNMLAVLSLRLRTFTMQLENISLKDVPARLAGYLLYLSGEQQKDDSVILPISKGQLASLLGTIPETLSRIFAKMSAQELISVKGREIKFKDMVQLKEIALNGRIAEPSDENP